MDTINDRLAFFLGQKKIDKNKLENMIGVSNGVIGKFINGKSEIGVNKIEKILQLYPELNATWLMKGEGEMLVNTSLPIRNTLNQDLKGFILPHEADFLLKQIELKDKQIAFLQDLLTQKK